MKKLLLSAFLSSAVAVFGLDMPLYQGWNLVGGLNDADLDVIKSFGITMVLKYNPQTQSYTEYTSKPFAQASDGLWLKSNSDMNLQAQPDKPASYKFYSGWNLVGAPTQSILRDSRISKSWSYANSSWVFNPTAEQISAYSGVWIYTLSNFTVDLNRTDIGILPPEINGTQTSTPITIISAPLSDAEFVALSTEKKRMVLERLFQAFYWGIGEAQMQKLLNSVTPLSTIRQWMTTSSDPSAVAKALEEVKDYSYDTNARSIEENFGILLKMPSFNKEYFQFWQAYWLVNSKFMSASLELNTVENSTGTNLTGWVYQNIQSGTAISSIMYEYFKSMWFWKRFRSAEDNTREALELTIGVFDDTLVPKAAVACQNWAYNETDKTLVVGLNANYTPQNILEHIVTNCEDFYKLVATNQRLKPWIVDHLMKTYTPNLGDAQKQALTNAVLQGTETFDELFMNFFFSKEYLLYGERYKSFEEIWFPLMRKLSLETDKNALKNLKAYADKTGNPVMYYKLGRPATPPTDVLSTTQNMRGLLEYVIYKAKTNLLDETTTGWSVAFLNDLPTDKEGFINAIYQRLVGRSADSAESADLSSIIDKDNLKISAGKIKASAKIMRYIALDTPLYIFQK